MTEVLQSESRPQVIEADFYERERQGDRIVRRFEGTRYQYPASAERVLGALALLPAGKNFRTTVEASFYDSAESYILPIGNSNYGIHILESDPDTLLNKTLAEGERVVEL